MNGLRDQIVDLLTPHSSSEQEEVCSSVDDTDVEVDGEVDHEANKVLIRPEVQIRKRNDNSERTCNLQKSSSNGVIKRNSGAKEQYEATCRLSSSQTNHCDGKLELVVDMVIIKGTARKLGHDIVAYAEQKTKGHPSQASDTHSKTLRRTVDYLLEKHQIPFTSMAKKLQIGEPGTSCQSFTTIADEMFVDKQYNWGRVVTLYAFAARLAEYCLENKVNEDWVKKIGETVGNYVADHLSDWIARQGAGMTWIDSFRKRKTPTLRSGGDCSTQ